MLRVLTVKAVLHFVAFKEHMANKATFLQEYRLVHVLLPAMEDSCA